MDFQITTYKSQYQHQIISVWEKSVLATHQFLSKSDFIEIKELLQGYDFETLDMFCLVKADQLVGFIGIHHSKIEMLFLDPAYIGKGLGRKLIEYVIVNQGANRVDVNEQNIDAKNFYQKFGFETFERTAKDDLGKDYPLLRMKLNSA